MARVNVRCWQETYRGLMSDAVLDDPGFPAAGASPAGSGCSRRPARPASAFLTCGVTAGGMTVRLPGGSVMIPGP